MPESAAQAPTQPVVLPQARGGQAAARPDLDFMPVRNGMDYLLSALEHLTGPEWQYKESEPDSRALKYAALHLHSATEVLLKARLTYEHWSLVFARPEKASLEVYRARDFSSCTVKDTLDRLDKVAQVTLEPADRAAITDLGATRNALTHFGDTRTVHLVEGQIAEVLRILLTFIVQHLRPTDSRDAAHVERAMVELRGRLGRFQELVRRRMDELTEPLREHAAYTVHCPGCRQEALVVGENPSCLFCLQTFAPAEAVLKWAWAFMGDPEDPEGDVRNCHCGQANTLVWPVTTVASHGDEVALCFACRAVYAPKENQ